MVESSMYRLINPYIEGSASQIVKSKNAFSAGKKLYDNLSSYTSNSMDKFHMTIQNLETGKLNHFEISENKPDDNSNDIEFKIKMLNDSLPKDTEKELVKKVTEMDKQTGGYSDSDSDSSAYDYNCNNLINKFTYFYLPYTKFVGLSRNDYPNLFMPVFVYPIAPVSVVRFDLFRF